MDSVDRARLIGMLRVVALAVGLPLIVLAAVGPRWPRNVISSPKDEILCVMIGTLVIAVSVLGPRFARAYTSTAVILLNTFVLFSVLEVGRTVYVEFTRPVNARSGVNPVLDANPDQRKHGYEYMQGDRQTYEPYILWRRAPYKGETITVNDAGIRDTPGSQCPPGAYKVFTFGGSAMWGVGAPDAQTIPALLRPLLEQQVGRPVCLVNYAQIAYVVSQDIAQLVDLLLNGEDPDLVIFYDGYNDVYVAYEQGRADRHFSYDQAKTVFEPRRSNWYEALSLYWAVYTWPNTWKDYEMRGKDADELAGDVAQRYFNAYAIVQMLADKGRFDFRLFIQPVIQKSKKVLTTGETVVRDDIGGSFEKLTEKIYSRLIDGIDGRDHLSSLVDVFDDSSGEIWFDAVHVSPAGNRIVAERMSDILASQSPRSRVSPSSR